MRERTDKDEEEFLKWLLETGKITKEMYDATKKMTKEEKELAHIKSTLNSYPDSETVKKLLERKKELEKIVMEQEK